MGFAISARRRGRRGPAIPSGPAPTTRPFPVGRAATWAARDYHTLQRGTRIVSYGSSWLERQDNVKTIDAGGGRTPLARELGKTWYVRLPDAECAVGAAFARERQAFWTLLRETWDGVLGGRRALRGEGAGGPAAPLREDARDRGGLSGPRPLGFRRPDGRPGAHPPGHRRVSRALASPSGERPARARRAARRVQMRGGARRPHAKAYFLYVERAAEGAWTSQLGPDRRPGRFDARRRLWQDRAGRAVGPAPRPRTAPINARTRSHQCASTSISSWTTVPSPRVSCPARPW